MEYQVPQFIEVEDKIIGPLTMKQFIYVAGTAGIVVTLFLTMSFIFAAILSIPIVAFGVALSFYKINGKTFVEMLEAGFNFYVGEKFFLWKQVLPTEQENKTAATAAAVAAAESTAASAARNTPRLTRGKLSELAWSLDVKSSDSITTRADS